MPGQGSRLCWGKKERALHEASQLPLPHSRDFSLTIDVLWLLRGLATCCCSQSLSSSPIHNKYNSKDIFLTIEKQFFSFFSAVLLVLYNCLFLNLVPPPLLCPYLSFSLLIPRGTIKQHKVTGFVTRAVFFPLECKMGCSQ